MVEPRPGRCSYRRAAAFHLTTVLVAGLWASVAGADDTCCVCPSATDSMTAEEVQITLELIMSDPDWLGHPPENPFWAESGEAIFFEQKRPGEEHRDLYRIELATGEIVQVSDEQRGIVDVPEGRLSHDRKLKVYSRHGDIYLQDLSRGGKITQLTRTSELEIEPFFMAPRPDERRPRVAFTRAGQVFVRDLESGLESQGVDLQLIQDPADEEEDDGSDFLKAQQLRLFDHLRLEKQQRERTRELAEIEQSADPSRPPLPFYLGDELEIRQSVYSPDGNAMMLVVIDKKRDEGRKDQMPAWITASGYVENQEVRAKVGTEDGRGERLLYLDLTTHQQHEIDLTVLPGIAEDPLAELKQKALAAQAEAESKTQVTTDASETEARETPAPASDESESKADSAMSERSEESPRSVRFEEAIAWSPDGQALAVQAHSYDNKDRWLALVDFEQHRLQLVHHLQDPAWINWSYNDFGWLSNSRSLYFLSEANGSSQLYLYSLEDGTTRRLTDGRGVVSALQLDRQEQYFYYTANPEHPGIYETFRVAIEGGQIEQVTRLGGQNSSLLSPDGKSLLITHSTTTRPPELYLQSAQPGAAARRITHTVSERFTSLPWVEPEIVGVPSSHHSQPIYSRFYPPQCEREEATDAGRPAVVFVHGAGYLQNAHHGWSGYFREFMFHTLLTRHGYAVLDMDYRASAGYGVEWRTAIYRQMGTPELEDLADGVAWLTNEHGVDPDRVGVYGGSYGGFLTLMALFQQPELFAAGAALRPVTDWSQYNHPYTSNILNTPDVDPEAYHRSSPIEHVAGLAAPLLLCAPMQDDNVFFADTVRLVQRLIELEKEDWEVAIYPVEPHGFRRPSSWLDEYRRIFKLFETHLSR